MGAGQSPQCSTPCCNSEEGTEPYVGAGDLLGVPGTQESLENRTIQSFPVIPAAPKSKNPKTIDYSDNSSYSGDVVDGRRHGFGTFRSPAETYQGQWQNDQQHGQGEHNWTDGRAYVGQYVNGRFSGRGKLTWTTDKGIMVYEGEYENDTKHGQGKFTWSSGNVYDGGWLHGKRHGRATFKTSSGKQKYGLWKDDKFVNWIEQKDEKKAG